MNSIWSIADKLFSHIDCPNRVMFIKLAAIKHNEFYLHDFVLFSFIDSFNDIHTQFNLPWASNTVKCLFSIFSFSTSYLFNGWTSARTLTHLVRGHNVVQYYWLLLINICSVDSDHWNLLSYLHWFFSEWTLMMKMFFFAGWVLTLRRLNMNHASTEEETVLFHCPSVKDGAS